uniref:5'-deoxynucleotidase n=1 Tax=Rhodotorula toruloides TaxID=5286 RepID=A0A0K3CJM1_RHOTO
MSTSLSSTNGTPAAPEVPQDCQEGVLGFFHTLERLKVCTLSRLEVGGPLTLFVLPLSRRLFDPLAQTGWVNNGIENAESIADHMYRMAMMCLAFPETQSLDISKCVMLSIVHDLAEADVGDITPEHASGVSKAQKLALEEKAMERMVGLLGHPSIASLRLKSLWEEYEARETPESKFVKDLDLFELCVQAVEYENSQHCKTLQGFFETTVTRIQHSVVKGWARELMAQRRAKWAERGWNDYQEILPLPDANGDAATPAKPTISVVRKTSGPTRRLSRCDEVEVIQHRATFFISIHFTLTRSHTAEARLTSCFTRERTPHLRPSPPPSAHTMAAPVAAVAALTPPRPASVYSTRSPAAARTLDSSSAPRPASVVIAGVCGAEGGAEAIAARRRNSGSFKHMSTGGLVSNSPFQKLAGGSPTKAANPGLGLYNTSRIPTSAAQGGPGRRTSGSRRASGDQDGPVKENSNPSELNELALGRKKSSDSLARSRSSSPGAPLMPVRQATAATSSMTAPLSSSPFKPTRPAFGSASRNPQPPLDDIPRRQTSSFAALRQNNLVSSSPFTSKSATAPSPELQQAPYEIEPLTRESAPSAYYELSHDDASPQLASSAKMNGQMGLGARPGPALASAGGRIIAGSSVPPPNTPPRERHYSSEASPSSSLRSPGGSALAQTRRGMRGPRPISGGYDDGDETEREDIGRTVRRQPSSKSVAWAETEEVFEFEVEDERRRSGLSDASTLSDEGRYYGHDSSDEESDSPQYTHQPDGSFTYEEGGSVEVHDVEVGSDADESVVSSASSAMDEVIGQIDEYLHEESEAFDETDVFSPSQIPSFTDQPDLPSHHDTSGYSSPNIPQAPASAFSVSTESGADDCASEVMSASSYDDDEEDQQDAHFTATKEAILSRGRASLPDAPGSPGRPPLPPAPISLAAKTLAPQQPSVPSLVKSKSQFSLPDIPGTSPFLGFEDDGAAQSVVTLDGEAQPLSLPATKPLQPRPHDSASKTAPAIAPAALGSPFTLNADRTAEATTPASRVEASPVLSRKASLVGSDVTTSSVSWYGSSVNGSLRGGTIRLGRDRLEERMKAHQALFGDSSPLPSFGAFPSAAKTTNPSTSQPSTAPADSRAIEAQAAPKARSATLSSNMMPTIAASPQRGQLGVSVGSPLTAEVAEEMQSPLERLQRGMKGRQGGEWRSGDSLLGVAEVAEGDDDVPHLAPLKSGRPTRRRSRSTGDASIAETSSTALQAQLTMPELGFERKAGDAGFGSSVLESLDDIYNSRNRTYRVRESKQLVVVSDFTGSRAGDVDPGRAWRKKRPSDVHAINRSLSTMSVNSQSVRKSREYVVRDVSFEGMPMPRQRVSVTATLDNGRQKVDAAVRELSSKVSLKKEFELICNQDLAFSIHFSVPRPPPSSTPTMPSAPSPAPTPPASPSKTHRALRLFSSPKKKPTPTKAPTAPPPTPDPFFDYVSSDGQLATARVTFASEAGKCRLKKSRILVPFVSKSSSSPRSCSGALTVDLLFVPAVSGVPKANLPKSMDEVLEGLELAEWATKITHEGVLTQLGGDTTVWRRRIVKLRGSTLVPYSEVTKRSHVEINLALVSQIEDLNVATVQSPKSRASRFEDEDEDLSRMDNSFRLIFKYGNRIDFYADSPEAKSTWLSVLSVVVGKEDGKKAPPEWAVAVRKLPPPKSY